MRRIAIGLAVLAVVVIAFAGQANALPTCTKTAAVSGDWAATATWGGAVPGAGDTVCIPSGRTVTLAGPATVSSIQIVGKLSVDSGTLALASATDESLLSGELAGAGTLQVAGPLTWSGGYMTGAGVTRVLAGAVLTQQTNFVNLWDTRALEIAGSLRLATADRGIFRSGSPVISVSASGVVENTSAGAVTVGPVLHNAGVVRSPGAGSRLELDSGGGTGASDGDFGSAGALGTVRFDGSAAHKLADGARLLGGVEIAGAVTIPDGATVAATGANSESGSGDLQGAGTLEIGGTFAWTGGYMTGAGVTKVLAGAVLTQQTNFVNLWDTRTLDVAGTLQLATAARGIFRSGSPVITVGGTGVVENTSAGVVTVGPVLHNAGVVRSPGEGSQLELDSGGGTGASDGDFGSAGALGTVRFDGSTAHKLAHGARLLGGVEIAGAVTIPDGATVTASGANRHSGSGDLQGAGTLEIGGTYAWTGGYMTGSGLTRVLAGAVVTQQTNSVNLWDTRRLENAGTIVLATADRGISRSGSPSVHNLAGATIRKTAGGTSIVDAVLENDGTIESTVAGSTLTIRGGTATDPLWGSRNRVSGGSFGGAGGGVVRLDSGSTGRFALGAGAGFPGPVTLATGTLAIPAGLTVAAGGPFTQTGGILDGDGTLALTAGGSWTGGDMAGGGTTSIAAGTTLALPATGGVELGGTRRLLVDGVLDAAEDNSLFATFASSPLLHVRAGGVLRKSAGDTWSFVDVPLRNDGTVESLAGELRLSQGAADPHTGVFRSASAADRVAITGEGHVFAGSADIQDHTRIAGDVAVRNGDTLTLDDEVVQSGGELTGDVTVTGTLTWSGGEQTGPGTTAIAPAGRIVIEPDDGDTCASPNLSDGRRLVNDGVLRLLAGSDLSMFGDPRAEIHNAGRIELDSGGGDCGDFAGIVGDGLVANAAGATIEKLGGAGGSQVSSIDNDGTVLNAAAGPLHLDANAGARHAGAFETTGAGTIAFDFGDFIFDSGATLAGNVEVAGADLHLPAGLTLDVPAGRTLVQSAGSIGGEGDLRIAGTLTWTGGYQEGTGATLLEPGSTATVAPAAGDDSAFAGLGASRSLVNRGTMTVEDAYFEVRDGASILNRGTLELRGDSELEGFGFGGGFDSVVHNTGVLRKTGASTIDARVPIDNDGTVEVDAGSLELYELVNWTGIGFLGETGIAGGEYVVRGTLVVPGAVTANAARLVLDGAASKVVHRTGAGVQADSLVTLERNAGGGELVLRGGRSLTLAGALANQGSLELGAGSTLTAKGFTQSAGAVLRPAVTAGGVGRVTSSAPAQLGGRLAAPEAPAVAGTHAVLSAPSVGGAFASVSGAYDVEQTATEVRLKPDAGSGRRAPAPAAGGPETAAGESAPAGDDPAPTGGSPEPAAGDAAPLAVTGPWQRRRAVLSATRRGARIAVRGVRGRELALVARSCRRCGAVRVRWAGRRRTVSLAGRPGVRTIRVLALGRERTGTVRIAAASGRRVAVRALLVR